MTSFIICKTGLTMPSKNQVLIFVYDLQDQMLKDSCFYLSAIPATCLFIFVIFLKYFEILWYSIVYLRHVSKLV